MPAEYSSFTKSMKMSFPLTSLTLREQHNILYDLLCAFEPSPGVSEQELADYEAYERASSIVLAAASKLVGEG